MTTKTLSPQEVHDLKVFYNFFDAIPDENWCIINFTNILQQHCALGHLCPTGWPLNKEAQKLQDLFEKHLGVDVGTINNGFYAFSKTEAIPATRNPKSNTLAALKFILSYECP